MLPLVKQTNKYPNLPPVQEGGLINTHFRNRLVSLIDSRINKNSIKQVQPISLKLNLSEYISENILSKLSNNISKTNPDRSKLSNNISKINSTRQVQSDNISKTTSTKQVQSDYLKKISDNTNTNFQNTSLKLLNKIAGNTKDFLSKAKGKKKGFMSMISGLGLLIMPFLKKLAMPFNIMRKSLSVGLKVVTGLTSALSVILGFLGRFKGLGKYTKKALPLASKGLNAAKIGGTKALPLVSKGLSLGKLGSGKALTIAGSVASKGKGALGSLSRLPGLGKMGGKLLPGMGLVLGAGFAANRAMKGDITGAGLELLGGLASTIPGIGTAASLAIQGGLIARDMSKKSSEKTEDNLDIANKGIKGLNDINKKYFGEALNLSKKMTKGLGSLVENSVDGLKKTSGTVIKTLSASIPGVMLSISSGAKTILSNIQNGFSSMMSGISNFISNPGQTSTNVVNSIKEGANNASQAVVNNPITQAVVKSEPVKSVVGTVKEMPRVAAETVKNPMSNNIISSGVKQLNSGKKWVVTNGKLVMGNWSRSLNFKGLNVYKDMIVKKAKAAGIDPAGLLAMANIESGFDPNAQNTYYGGLFAIEKARHPRWRDPEYNTDMAIKNWKANEKAWKKAHPDKPFTAGAAYLMHNQGIAGGVALYANPNRKATDVLRKWHKNSARVVRNNGGNTNMSGREFAQMWIDKAEALTGYYTGQTTGGDLSAPTTKPTSINRTTSNSVTGMLSSAYKGSFLEKGVNYVTNSKPVKAVSRAIGNNSSPVRTVSNAISKMPVSSLVEKGKSCFTGKSLDGLVPAFKDRLLALFADYYAITGKKVQVNSGFRTRAMQEALYRTKPKGMAAKPGRSMHEFGLAVDISSAQANEMAKRGLLEKHGFWRPLMEPHIKRKEAWHIEHKSIGKAIKDKLHEIGTATGELLSKAQQIASNALTSGIATINDLTGKSSNNTSVQSTTSVAGQQYQTVTKTREVRSDAWMPKAGDGYKNDILSDKAKQYVNENVFKATGIVYTKKEEAKRSDLVKVNGYDVHKLAAPWLKKMIAAAKKDGVTLTVGSAFRDIAYQQGIIDRKKKAGQSTMQIYTQSAPPGYSEHHTGMAIDFSPINQSFARTPGYRWLRKHASEYGFYQTYTDEGGVTIGGKKMSRTGTSIEPWHWCFKGKTSTEQAVSESLTHNEFYKNGMTGGTYTETYTEQVPVRGSLSTSNKSDNISLSNSRPVITQSVPVSGSSSTSNSSNHQSSPVIAWGDPGSGFVTLPNGKIVNDDSEEAKAFLATPEGQAWAAGKKSDNKPESSGSVSGAIADGIEGASKSFGETFKNIFGEDNTQKIKNFFKTNETWIKPEQQVKTPWYYNSNNVLKGALSGITGGRSNRWLSSISKTEDNIKNQVSGIYDKTNNKFQGFIKKVEGLSNTTSNINPFNSGHSILDVLSETNSDLKMKMAKGNNLPPTIVMQPNQKVNAINPSSSNPDGVNLPISVRNNDSLIKTIALEYLKNSL